MDRIIKYLNENGLEIKLSKNRMELELFIIRYSLSKKRDLIVQNFLMNMGKLKIRKWEKFYKTDRDLTKKTREDLKYVFGQYELHNYGDNFFVKPLSYARIFSIANYKTDGVNELIRGWELESVFLDKEQIVPLLNGRICEKINSILEKSEVMKKVTEELPYIIFGEEFEEKLKRTPEIRL